MGGEERESREVEKGRGREGETGYGGDDGGWEVETGRERQSLQRECIIL